MSKYQFYEFLAMDRPLSAEDMAYVRTLSSRVQPTSTQAVFTYSFARGGRAQQLSGARGAGRANRRRVVAAAVRSR